MPAFLQTLKFAFLVFISAASLLSCSSKTAVPEKSKTEAIAATSADTNHLPRSIASLDDVEAYEGAYQQILLADDAGAAMKSYFDRAARLFYRTQSLLEDYDAKIDEVINSGAEAASLQTDPTYARLVAAWTLREQLHSKIRFFYLRNLEMRGQPGDQTKAQKIESVFKTLTLTNSNAVDRLAKQDLIEDVLQMNESFRDAQANRENPAVALVARSNKTDQQLQTQWMSDPKKLQNFFTNNKSAIHRRAVAARTDDELNGEINSLLPAISQNLADQFESRSPQGAEISPQTGPNGMMTGSNFKQGRWALTFDDGPHAKFTPMALENLNQYGLKATFFWLADNVPRLKTIVGKVREANMTLACHSFSHPQLTKLSSSALHHEIVDAMNIETSVYGAKPTFFRCPYGACGSQSSAVRQMIAANQMISVIWNVDSLDWQDKNPVSVYHRVKKQMAALKRGIILFHDIHPQSIAASRMLMADLSAGEKTGQYRVITIQQAKDELNSPGGMK